MKKAQKNLMFHGRSVALHRDTFEEILDVLTKHCKTVTITDGDFEFESLDELESKRGSHPKSVELAGSSPYVFFHVSRGSNGRSWVAVMNEEGATPYLLISELLRQHARTWLRRLLNPFSCLVYIVLIAILMVVFKKHFTVDTTFIAMAAVYLFVGIGLFRLSLASYSGELSSISLKRKHETVSFWSANKDKIWLIVIGGVIGGILTKLVPFLLSRLGF